MSDSSYASVDGTRLLVDLQRVIAIAKRFSGCLDPETIALRVTDGLIEKFGCTLARIWLVERDRTQLRLVASSGLHTRIDGTFAKVPMGAFKVGKIAQNQIPFLSNQLAEETWVKDRDWAIANGIQGFAGYPLAIADHVIGVLAVFSQDKLESEFLEVLQSLCTTTTIALQTALHYQDEKRTWQSQYADVSAHSPVVFALSEQLAQALKTTQMTLVGTERSLNVALVHLFLGAAQVLSQLQCIYGRLTYGADQVSLEVMIEGQSQNMLLESKLAEVQFATICLGGTLSLQADVNPDVLQVVLRVPYGYSLSDQRIAIQCRSSLVQLGLTRLVYLAGFQVSAIADPTIPLLSDDPALAETSTKLIWLKTGTRIPKQARAAIDLNISPQQLREAVTAVDHGEQWELSMTLPQDLPLLSEREREIMLLLIQGLRDRDIASRLIISESTVKFHMNNVLRKLKARTRFQALYQAIAQGWITPAG